MNESIISKRDDKKVDKSREQNAKQYSDKSNNNN